MVEPSIIIPLLTLSFLTSSILRDTKVKIGWKFIILGSLLGGLGNFIYTAVLSFLQKGLNKLSILISSFLVGFFIILIVFAFTILFLKIRKIRRESIEE